MVVLKTQKITLIMADSQFAVYKILAQFFAKPWHYLLEICYELSKSVNLIGRV